MLRFIANRVLASIPVLLVASVIVFGAMRLLPGDPIDALYPADAAVSPEARAELRQELGLDQQLPAQYLHWLGRILQGDLGTSVRAQRPVTALIVEPARATGELALIGTVLGLLVALPLGTLAATRRGRLLDFGATGLALTGISVPAFALGTFLALVFGVWLGWVPTVGNLVLPAVTVAIGTAGFLVRAVRSDVLDQLSRDYVRTARGKGLPASMVYGAHVLPNALPVTVSVLATTLGYQLGGVVVVEQVFDWPGLGTLMFQSITGRDYAVVQAIALIAVLAFVVVNLTADVVRAALDPRLR